MSVVVTVRKRATVVKKVRPTNSVTYTEGPAGPPGPRNFNSVVYSFGPVPPPNPEVGDLWFESTVTI